MTGLFPRLSLKQIEKPRVIMDRPIVLMVSIMCFFLGSFWMSSRAIRPPIILKMAVMMAARYWSPPVPASWNISTAQKMMAEGPDNLTHSKQHIVRRKGVLMEYLDRFLRASLKVNPWFCFSLAAWSVFISSSTSVVHLHKQKIFMQIPLLSCSSYLNHSRAFLPCISPL